MFSSLSISEDQSLEALVRIGELAGTDLLVVLEIELVLLEVIEADVELEVHPPTLVPSFDDLLPDGHEVTGQPDVTHIALIEIRPVFLRHPSSPFSTLYTETTPRIPPLLGATAPVPALTEPAKPEPRSALRAGLVPALPDATGETELVTLGTANVAVAKDQRLVRSFDQ
jgi:hypothetical protein